MFNVSSDIKLRMIVDEGIIVPSTVLVPEGELDNNTIV